MNKPSLLHSSKGRLNMESKDRIHHNGSCSFWKAFMDDSFTGWDE